MMLSFFVRVNLTFPITCLPSVVSNGEALSEVLGVSAGFALEDLAEKYGFEAELRQVEPSPCFHVNKLSTSRR